MSITAFEFTARLARKHAGKGPSDLTAVETAAIAEAINAALSELYRLLPIHYRQREVAFTATPRQVSIAMTAGSSVVPAATFLASEVGCSVLFSSGGDAAWHQVAATNRLRLPWAGASGTATGMVLADAARGPDGRIERIVTDLVLVGAEGHRRRLAPMIDAERDAWLANFPRIGTPDFYQLQPAGAVEGGEAPVAWIRLWPLPTAPVRLVAVCEIWPARVRAHEITDGATTLAIPEDAIEDTLDLAGERLAAMPGFSATPLQVIGMTARLSRMRLSARMPTTHAPRNRVITPYGF